MASNKTTKKNAKVTKKSAPAKRTPAKKSTVSESTVATSPKTTRPTSSAPRVKRSYIVIALVVLLVLGLLYLLRSFFVAAVVNGQPVTRVAVVTELERQSGKQALNTLVTKTLINQEAEKEHVTVSQNEINAEMKKIEDNVKQQGQTLDQVLALQGMDRKGLEDQIRIQKEVEKILGKSITVSDKEVADYIEKNKEALGVTDTDSADMKGKVKEQLRQQKLSEKFQTWIQDLQKKAKIDYYVKY